MTHIQSNRLLRVSGLLAVMTGALILSGCGGGGASGPSTYTVGGSVTGISGGGLVLRVNGGDDVAVDADGTFSFAKSFSHGDSYEVTLLSAPSGQACRISDGSGDVTANVTNVAVECRTNVNPTGYYGPDGGGDVMDGSGNPQTLSDFQVIVHDGRFMAMSVTAGLIYDGQMTLFGDEFSAKVAIYYNGLRVQSDVPVTGTIVEGSSIDVALSGSGRGTGAFSASYSLVVNQNEADVARVVTGGGNLEWSSPIANSTLNGSFEVDSSIYVYGGSGAASGGNFDRCTIYTVSGGDPVAFIPLSGSSLYRMTVQLGHCTNGDIKTSTAGTYTGFATQTSTDDRLVLMVTSANGQYAVGGDFE